GNGVAVYGGNLGKLPAGGAPEEKDKVISIFSADKLPLTRADNDTGWVYWVGTSFATPIISAIAADLWMRELMKNSPPPATVYGPGEIIRDVRGYVQAPDPDLD